MNRTWGGTHQVAAAQYPRTTIQEVYEGSSNLLYPSLSSAYTSTAQRSGAPTARRPALWVHESRLVPRLPYHQPSPPQTFDPVNPLNYYHPEDRTTCQNRGIKKGHYPAEVLFYEHRIMHSNSGPVVQQFVPGVEQNHIPSRVLMGPSPCTSSPFTNKPVMVTAHEGHPGSEYRRNELQETDDLRTNHQLLASPSRETNLACTDMAVDAQLLLEAANQAAKEVRSITPVSSPTSAFGKPNINVAPPLTFCEIIDSSELVSMELYGTVGDALLVSMSQMKLCRLSEEDRFGNYKHRQLGFVGICCKFCGGLPGFGRHFPGSFQSLLSGSHCVRIVKHMRSECRSCPPSIRGLIKDIEDESNPQVCIRSQSQVDHGSRKRFVAHVWAKLQEAAAEDYLPPDTNGTEIVPTNTATSQSVDCAKPVVECSDLTWDTVIKQSQLVEERDLHLVPGATLFALAQMNEWPLTAEDKIGRHKDQQLGFVGLCCKFCNGKTGRPRYGRYFPSCLKTLAKPASCDRIANHISTECPKCPELIRSIMQNLQRNELTNEIRYGSRNIFFQRLWHRLHENDKTMVASSPSPTCAAAAKSVDFAGVDQRRVGEAAEQNVESSTLHDHWNVILDGSPLVTAEDRGLVPDVQLAAMAQLAPCRLTAQDRVGWYKERPIGFPGFTCRHCKGRPGIGRYFPNTLRTFSQNNYCQIVGNHLKKDCSSCPEDLRALLSSTLLSSSGVVSKDSKMYAKGSRKALYDRIWSSVHHPNGSNGTSIRSVSIGSSASHQGTDGGTKRELLADHSEETIRSCANHGDQHHNKKLRVEFV